MPDQWIIQDGIIAWFDGPEWDDIAEQAFNDAADELVAHARDNAPWEDRTGDARAGLSAKVDNDDGLITLTLFHTVEYGLWLEVIQNGSFATIMPTLESNAPEILRRTSSEVASARQGDNF